MVFRNTVVVTERSTIAAIYTLLSSTVFMRTKKQYCTALYVFAEVQSEDERVERLLELLEQKVEHMTSEFYDALKAAGHSAIVHLFAEDSTV